MTTTIEPSVAPVELPPLKTQPPREEILHLIDELVAVKGEGYVDGTHTPVVRRIGGDLTPGCLFGHLAAMKGLSMEFVSDDFDAAMQEIGWYREHALVNRGVVLNDMCMPWGEISHVLRQEFPETQTGENA